MIKAYLIYLALVLWTISSFAQSPKMSNLFPRQKTKAQWNCPQINYPQVRQLRSKADVKISVEGDEVPRIELEPSIFKINPFSLDNAQNMVNKPVEVGVDYSACIERFKLSLKGLIETKKSEYCFAGSKKPICKFTTEDITKAINQNIESSEFLQNNKKRIIIPRILPGSTGAFEPSEIKNEFLKMRNNESFDVSTLLSQEGMNFLSDNQTDLKKDDFEKLKTQFKNFQENLTLKVCNLSQKLCDNIKKKLELGQTKLSVLAQKKNAEIDRIDREWLPKLNLPTSEEEAIKQMRESLKENPFKCDLMYKTYPSNGRVFTAGKFPHALADNLEQFSKVADRFCISMTLQNLARAYENSSENGKDFKNFCQGNNSATCKLAKERLAIMEKNLKRLFIMRNGSQGERYIEENEDCFLHPTTPDQTILSILEKHNKALICDELKEGEHKIISSLDGSPSGLAGNYLLKRTGPKTHQLLVGIDIAEDGHGVKKEEMYQRIQSCIKDITPYLKGPSGEQLQMSTISPKEAERIPRDQRPLLHKIGIQSPGGRSHSLSYEADIDCPTITHEVLHLLGLCDEYNGHYDGYSCRAVAGVPSIMSGQYAAFDSSVDRTYDCTCYPNSSCEKIKDSTDEQLKNFFVQPSFYKLTDYEQRNKYCKWELMERTTWEKIKSDRRLQIADQSSNRIDVMHLSFEDKWPQIERSMFRCECEAGDQKCSEFIQKIAKKTKNIEREPLTSCPDGSKSQKSSFGNNLPSGNNYEWNPQGIKVMVPAKSPSLLLPSHYERIIGGACDQVAKKYNECAKWAYRSKEKTNNCEGRPSHCEDGTDFLGVKK